MKRYLLLFILLLISSVPFLAGAVRPLEVQYPPVPGGILPPATAETELPVYFGYIFNFFIWVTGFIALCVLFYGGFRYLTSAGRPEALADARNQIIAALLGLLILMSSWLILTTINPSLRQLTLEPLPAPLPGFTPGIYLCLEDRGSEEWQNRWVKDAWELRRNLGQMDFYDNSRTGLVQLLNDMLNGINENCLLVSTTAEIPVNFDDLAQMAWVVPPIPPAEEILYGALLYDESNFSGDVQVIYTFAPEPANFEITAIEPSSVKSFILEQPRPGAFVEVYALQDFNRTDPQRERLRYTPTSLASEYIDLSSFPENEVGSIQVEGSLIVIFFQDFQESDWPPDAVLDVVTKTDANLHDNLMGYWCDREVFGEPEYYPCPQQMVVVSGGFY